MLDASSFNQDRRRDEEANAFPVLSTLFNIVKPEKKSFRAIPIISTEKEILAPQPGDILVNRIDEGYDSIDE